MLHLSTVDSTTLELLKKLQSIPILHNTRLVGGTALALQIGHRKSVDLDFFGTVDASKDELTMALEQIGSLVVLKESPHIHIYQLNNVKIDVVDYQYSWIDDAVVMQGIRMASLRDIAAMKITAIIGRGTKKDFIDIAFLLQRFSITPMTAGTVHPNPISMGMNAFPERPKRRRSRSMIKAARAI